MHTFTRTRHAATALVLMMLLVMSVGFSPAAQAHASEERPVCVQAVKRWCVRT